MLRNLLIAVCLALLSLPAVAEIQPFPENFRTEEIKTADATFYVRVGGPGTGRGDAAWLRRHRRHVGAAGACAGAGPHRDRARPARHGPLLAPGRRLRQAHEAADIAGVLDKLAYPRPIWSPTTSATWSAMRWPRSIPSGSRGGWRWMRRCQASAIGTTAEEPEDLALQLPRPGRGAPGRRPRAHLPRPLLQRTLGQPSRSTRRPASTTPRSMPGRAPCTTRSSSSRLSAGRRSTTRLCSPRAS